MDTFPFAGTETELLLLECRLTELYDVIDQFVIVEATTDHQGHPKPLNYAEHIDQYAAWKDKITYVIADDLPSVEENDWSWAREHAQRDWVIDGLRELPITDDTIILHGDADEIPRALHARNVRPQRAEMISFMQHGHFWAIDWEYPPGWCGTVATRAGNLAALERPKSSAFVSMRNSRNVNGKKLDNAGWHFSWLGGHDAAMQKVGAFCHPEVELRIREGYERFWREGIHVDHIKMIPVDVDKTWPKWMQNRENVPESWYRPR